MTTLFRRFLTRPPEREELTTLVEYLHAQQKRLEDGDLDGAELTGEDDATPDLAAWSMVARAMINLDETITKH